MSEPAIYVIPAAYYGGATPAKARPPKTESVSGLAAGSSADLPRRRVSIKTVFIIVTAVLFVATIAGAFWYFTRGAVPAISNLTPPIVTEPASIPTSESTPTPVVPPAETPPDEKPAEVSPVVRSDSDMDNDKLTVAEEIIYHTDSTRPDTDNDGFLDGHEVENLYNPSGVAPEKLEDAKLVMRFSSPTEHFELLYPSAWSAPTISQSREAHWSVDGEDLAVLIMDNPNKLSLREFVEKNFSGEVTDWASNKSGLNGLFSKGDRQVRGFFASPGVIYELQYTPFMEIMPDGKSSGHASYNKTFEMMLNSFVVR